MKCYYHLDIDAVSTCSHCGKFLCKECTDKYRPILCDECYEEVHAKEQEDEKQFVSSLKRSLAVEIFFVYLRLVFGFVFAWLTCWLFDRCFDYFLHSYCFYLVFFLPYAWYAVRNRFPTGGCFLLLLKYIFCSLVGVVFYVWDVARRARDIREALMTPSIDGSAFLDRHNVNRRVLAIVAECLFVLSNIVLVAFMIIVFGGLRSIRHGVHSVLFY